MFMYIYMYSLRFFCYLSQVRDFTNKLEESRESGQHVKDALRDSQERESMLDSQLTSTSAKLAETEEKLGEAIKRIKSMEDDAGAEFRNKIRLLERKLADAVAKVCLCVVWVYMH